MEAHKSTASTAEPGSLGWRELAAIVGAALAIRLVGLGHVSLWLDEVLGTLQIEGPFQHAWHHIRADIGHPPLWGLLQWIWLQVSAADGVRRLLPIALGAATVPLLASVAASWLGRRAGLIAGAIAALSPVHVRFSQELRPYALALFAGTLALVLADKAARNERLSSVAALALALLVCFSSLYIGLVMTLPSLLVLLARSPRERLTRNAGRGLAAAAAAGLGFLPCLGPLVAGFRENHVEGATHWNAALLSRRMEFLTTAAREGDGLTLGGVAFALLAFLGLVRIRSRGLALTLFCGLVVGSLSVEIALQLADHWSNGRYDLMSWPFLVILAAAGAAGVPKDDHELERPHTLPVWLHATAGGLGAVLLAAALLGEAGGLLRYYRVGRPDWESVARDTTVLAALGHTVLVTNEGTRVPLAFELARLEGTTMPSLSPRPRRIESSEDLSRLVSAVECAVLVDAWEPTPPGVEQLFLQTPAQRRYRRSGARLVALSRSQASPWACFPEELDDLVPERPPPGILSPQRAWKESGLGLVLDFDGREGEALDFGWSFPEKGPDGLTFRWSLGEWSAVELPRTPRALAFMAWARPESPGSPPAPLRLYLDRVEIASLTIEASPQTVSLELPAGSGRSKGRHMLSINTPGWARPVDNPRPLAVAWDWIRVE